MLALKVTLPPETRPGVRVDQTTARLARAQKLKVKLEEKLFEAEAVVQDYFKEIDLAAEELENAEKKEQNEGAQKDMRPQESHRRLRKRR